MTINSFKVFCLPLSKSKQETLQNMINEYSQIYNYASRLIPSMKGSKHLKFSNPSTLYTKWIKSKKIERKYIGSLEAFNAIKDAVANFKTHGNLSEMKEPNIIKFEKSRYEIIKLNNHYGIKIGGKNGIYLPLVTGDYEKLNEFLDVIIKTDSNPGNVLYNLKENSISISHDINENNTIPKYKKDIEIDTIIGVDLGSNNLAALSVLKFKKEDVEQKIIDFKMNGKKFISRNDIPIEIAKVELISGLGNRHRLKYLKKVNKWKQKHRKDVGNRIRNIQQSNEHLISAKIAEIAKEYPNSLVVLEANLTNVRTRYSLFNPGGTKQKIEYKLNNIGIRTKEIHPAYTSQRCNKCGAIGIRQKGTVYFQCPSCGLGGSTPSSTIGQYNADVNASINIGLKGLFSLYGKKERNVDRVLNIDPNEHTQEDEPKPISEVCNGKKLCKDAILDCQNRKEVDNKENDKQTFFEFRRNCVPEKIQNLPDINEKIISQEDRKSEEKPLSDYWCR